MSDTVDDAAELALKYEDYQFALYAHRAAANVAPEVLDSDSDPILIARYSGHLEAAGRMEVMLGNDILAASAFLWAAAAFSELPKSIPHYKEARSILISQLRDIAKILQRERGRLIASAERRRLAAQCNTAALLLRTSPRRVPELLARE